MKDNKEQTTLKSIGISFLLFLVGVVLFTIIRIVVTWTGNQNEFWYFPLVPVIVFAYIVQRVFNQNWRQYAFTLPTWLFVVEVSVLTVIEISGVLQDTFMVVLYVDNNMTTLGVLPPLLYLAGSTIKIVILERRKSDNRINYLLIHNTGLFVIVIVVYVVLSILYVVASSTGSYLFIVLLALTSVYIYPIWSATILFVANISKPNRTTKVIWLIGLAVVMVGVLYGIFTQPQLGWSPSVLITVLLYELVLLGGVITLSYVLDQVLRKVRENDRSEV